MNPSEIPDQDEKKKKSEINQFSRINIMQHLIASVSSLRPLVDHNSSTLLWCTASNSVNGLSGSFKPTNDNVAFSLIRGAVQTPGSIGKCFF